MHLSHQPILFSLFPWALAQYGGGSPSSSRTTSTESATTTTSSAHGVQTVTVGKDNALAFSPDSITAAVGSSIEFVFYPPVHSVTQSSFDSPCAPLANGTGFWSGAITTTGDKTNTNVFTLTINDTNPIWFYCATPSHCETGMAGVINPPSGGSETLDQYKAAASKVSNPAAPSVVQGGSIGPSQAASTSSSASHSATSSAATTTPTKSASVRGLDTGGFGFCQWAPVALACLMAVGVGSLII
ncbi:Uncharacterized protein BP5553_10132 [Venustampulla echinocandica]|uniref:Cupredoxin n=1 Tax=Venustampulla echinocandica TaxID=2656787 RepID=A0A370TAE4_9HELO|nr:Uncharacterized protein BP5553_10132 [Venustampulla echinocandica]RDL30787.1 Uncharacterized protein BP5553_10132 [Venustampulla echinocandica]